MEERQREMRKGRRERMRKGAIVTPHAQRERGKVIGRGVHIYIYIYIYMSVVEKKI